jgi:L-ascorbate metabolism protein UlaG (beta-lactamase superfamily)
VPVDIVLSTHAHFDHDSVERPKGLMVLERLVGQFRLGDVKITGLADKHQCQSPEHKKWDRASADFHVETCPPNNVQGFDNAIQLIETGGLRIAIWGDNRATPDPSLDRELKGVDILVLPIDDTGTLLTPVEVNAIIEKYDPKAVIPAHYLVGGVTTDVSGFKSADEWVSKQKDVRRLETAEFTFNIDELKGAHHRIYYFGAHFDKQ